MGIHNLEHSSSFASTPIITMAAKKRIKTITASPIRAQAARDNSSLPHLVNKYNITVLDGKHTTHYDAIVTRKICGLSYLDVQMLATLYLYDDLRTFLVNLG